MHPSLRTKPAPLRAVALAVLEAKAADLLDVEYSLEQPRRVVLSAFEAGVPVVLSSYDFRAMPGADEIVASLRRCKVSCWSGLNSSLMELMRMRLFVVAAPATFSFLGEVSAPGQVGLDALVEFDQATGCLSAD